MVQREAHFITWFEFIMAWDQALYLKAELRTLWKGFTRQTIQRKLRAPRNPMDIESDIELKNDGDSEIEAKDDDDRDKFKQGKEPIMSPELFHKVCSWLMLECIFLCIPGILHAKATIPLGSG
jgi:hypothetical protein